MEAILIKQVGRNWRLEEENDYLKYIKSNEIQVNSNVLFSAKLSSFPTMSDETPGNYVTFDYLSQDDAISLKLTLTAIGAYGCRENHLKILSLTH